MKPILSHPDSPALPIHVAIIMDGNGRWAKARRLPRVAGHRKGAESVRTAVQSCVDLGISYLTLYGFSLENWKRPEKEIIDLMGLLRLYLRQEVDELDEEGVRLRFIGDREKLAPDIVALIEESEARTRYNTVLNLTIALSYGGRQEIASAARRLARDVASGKVDADSIDDLVLTRYLFTAEIPDPDLVIRTSGEQRMSNFLLWQSAYAELMFTDTLWPDFGRDDLEDAIQEFQSRERRYGATGG